jgi:hypothetical protein
MTADRPRRVRAFAQRLSETSGAEVTARHDAGARWTLEWVDGPTVATVRSTAAGADLAGAQLELMRHRSPRAYALVTLRLAQDGQLPHQRRLAAQLVEDTVYDTDHPERAEDARQERMVQRLLDDVRRAGRIETGDIVEQVSLRGLSWLLGEPSSALELLTARYATGDDQWRWLNQARPMPMTAAVSATLADPQIDQAAAAAVLELLPALRAEFARTEQAALAAARRTGVPAEAIARASASPTPGLRKIGTAVSGSAASSMQMFANGVAVDPT